MRRVVSGEGSSKSKQVPSTCGTEAGSYLRHIDSCITQLKAQGPSRTCNESKGEEKKSTSKKST